ncbi:putative bulb-type lectin domain-containing protein [Medicago truncatula]|uniref:Putative bulb-type lectin domain-containing protein n=1 Tax=Medicago truncatula TaxID=3880 RepID=A0A396GPS4_MEDTR|nr:putative bulb-type lectin domain-containing protein [Medicago truncatula]
MKFEQLTNFDNLAYLSIFPRGNDWYVWVANRDQPVHMDSNIREPIILYASPQLLNRSTIVATLLDTGNFVLKIFRRRRYCGKVLIILLIVLAKADVCYGYNTDKGCQKYDDKPTCRMVIYLQAK